MVINQTIVNIQQIKDTVGNSLIYLASPYTHECEAVRVDRFRMAAKAAADLMKHGLNIFSPISHTHPIGEFGLRGDWEFWKQYDMEFLKVCVGMIVLTIPGWDTSAGIAGEIEIMRDMGKPIWAMGQGMRLWGDLT